VAKYNDSLKSVPIEIFLSVNEEAGESWRYNLRVSSLFIIIISLQLFYKYMYSTTQMKVTVTMLISFLARRILFLSRFVLFLLRGISFSRDMSETCLTVSLKNHWSVYSSMEYITSKKSVLTYQRQLLLCPHVGINKKFDRMWDTCTLCIDLMIQY